MSELGGIELTGQRGTFANDFVLRGIFDGIRFGARATAVALPLSSGGSLSTLQPAQAKPKHDGRSDHTEARRSERRGTEKRHRDRVLDRWRPRKRRHRKSGGAECKGGRHQAMRNACCPKQRLSHWRQHKKGDEKAD